VGTVLGPSPRGLRVEVHGLYGMLSGVATEEAGAELEVLVSRLNRDEGRIFLARRVPPSDQLALLD
jgi:hypothetical protein